MRKFKFLGFILLAVMMFSVTSCGDDEPGFDAAKLEGIWNQVFDKKLMDASVVKYVFYPESSYSGRIEQYVSNWPDADGWTITDLNYRVGETGHMNIFTGKVHDGASKIYLEVDIHKLTKSEMVWYKTDSNEEIARFNKDTKIDNY